ncbi:Integral membrane protein SED5 [Coemansia sp. RSA 2531]|nr:Integral membrane protein SED5 [Coemansia sp. RSA 2531]
MSVGKARTLRDRTNEYRSLVSALRKRQQLKAETGAIDANGSKRQANAAHSEFSRHAGAIGKDIQDTTLLISICALKLVVLVARAKTIFDDKTSDINALTTQVKQRIAGINGKIMSLQALQRKQGTGANTSGSGSGQQASEHHSNIVMSLQSQLASTSTVFKDVLEMRSERLRASGNRKEQFIGTSAAAAGSMPLYSTGNVSKQMLQLAVLCHSKRVQSPTYKMCPSQLARCTQSTSKR